jgi:hypothetical protein
MPDMGYLTYEGTARPEAVFFEKKGVFAVCAQEKRSLHAGVAALMFCPRYAVCIKRHVLVGGNSREFFLLGA